MRLHIRHQTRYRFRRQVALQPHKLIVTPRGGNELRLVEFELDAGHGAFFDWAEDVFANRVATVSFAAPSDDLIILMEAVVEQEAEPFPIFNIAVEAHQYPFAYGLDDRIDLGALLSPNVPADADKIRDWAHGFVAARPTDTLSLLKDLNAGMLSTISYRVRDEEGTQSPAETLALGSGSCRDIAALFIDAARSLGFGARAVSGYLYDPTPSASAGSTHAWAEIYLPGAGWIAFDPTHRRVGAAQLIPVAVGRHNGQIMPVTGGYLGLLEDALSLDVSVSVSPA